ncbi:MAG: TIR domain-containing protein, partial [Butyrivibrio sp.]|nr:TIR domain-containing protein [Butyrivibrio sp.]
MINHFNAFISYKHAELDNKIAASIVRDLEHFHIPAKIQKSTGVKRINRIFRDKDELPITNDLNDTISQALYNSDFLIVICSTNTHKSTWVEREIETFLKNHTINQILTVLADGEPYDVIPKSLLTGKRQVVNEKGETITEEFPYEPLSCDYRMPYRKAKAEELPRLAAALIGCSYDELINRQRQYKMHRMAAVFAGAMTLSLGFAGYMFYSNTQIHKNYVESLRNQSKYLANESMDQLSNENRMEAMQLALAALPQDESDPRPETPEAVRALTNATLAYVSPAASNVSAVWNYQMPNKIKEFKVSDDGLRLAAIDLNGVVKAWDAETHAELISVNDSEDNCRYIEFFDSNTLVVLKGDGVFAYDLEAGKELWSNNSNDNFFLINNVFKYSDDSILLVCANGHLYEVGINDGALRNEYEIFNEEKADYMNVGLCDISEDKSKIAFFLKDREDYSNVICSIAEYNIAAKELNTYPVDAEFIGDICYQKDNIFYSCPDGNIDGSVKMFGYSYITEDHTDVYCLSSGDLSRKWQDECVSTDVMMDSGFLPMETGNIAYYAGGCCKIWNGETGDVVEDIDIGDSIIDASDRDGDGEPLFITNSGTTASYGTVGGTAGVQSIKRFSDNLVDARVAKGIYTQGY